MNGSPDVRVSPDLAGISARAAEAAATAIRDVVNANGRCALALSGGATPRTMYRALAERFRDRIPWADVHVFFTDERYVPPDDEHSNYRMARETLPDHVPCPRSNVHPMPTHHADPVVAAQEYEATLRAWFADAQPGFDLAILGLGADGHTASLFPGSPAVREETRRVLAVTADAEPPTRLTLTLPVLTASARTWFMVAGSNKAAAVHRVLTESSQPERAPVSPAAAVQCSNGAVVWWLDRDAAAHLECA